jgi:hypothetical protein
MYSVVTKSSRKLGPHSKLSTCQSMITFDVEKDVHRLANTPMNAVSSAFEVVRDA